MSVIPSSDGWITVSLIDLFLMLTELPMVRLPFLATWETMVGANGFAEASTMLHGIKLAMIQVYLIFFFTLTLSWYCITLETRLYSSRNYQAGPQVSYWSLVHFQKDNSSCWCSKQIMDVKLIPPIIFRPSLIHPKVFSPGQEGYILYL